MNKTYKLITDFMEKEGLTDPEDLPIMLALLGVPELMPDTPDVTAYGHTEAVYEFDIPDDYRAPVGFMVTLKKEPPEENITSEQVREIYQRMIDRLKDTANG